MPSSNLVLLLWREKSEVSGIEKFALTQILKEVPEFVSFSPDTPEALLQECLLQKPRAILLPNDHGDRVRAPSDIAEERLRLVMDSRVAEMAFNVFALACQRLPSGSRLAAQMGKLLPVAYRTPIDPFNKFEFNRKNW